MIKKKIKSVKPTVSKEVELCTSETCGTVKVIDKLTLSFGSEDMNKVVEKINEIIDKSNGSL